MSESIASYQEHLPSLMEDLNKHGNLALVLIDISAFGAIEEHYGTEAYFQVRQRLFDLIVGKSGQEFRKGDILALEEPGGLHVLLFLSPQRQKAQIRYEHLEQLRLRLMRSLVPMLARTAFPYLKKPPRISVGYAIGIHNAMVAPHHVILRTIREALERAALERRRDETDLVQRLKELILNRQVVPLYQPIVGLADGKPVAYEALCRGGAGTGLNSPNDLFDAAIKHHLLVELDKICRNVALEHSNRLPGTTKLFINTLPVTMRDPDFHGQPLIRLLEKSGITPDRIVIEITERMVIDNLGLFQEAMNYFCDLGMALAVDDVGAGHSGLETMGRLKPRYLKVDMTLVKDLHTSAVHREMLKGIVMMGRGMGAEVIAEGVETEAQYAVLRSLGVDYGQGFFLGRPSSMTREDALA